MGAFDSDTYRLRSPKMFDQAIDPYNVEWGIKAIQKQLLHLGFDPRRQDGIFGYFTKKAVKKFQQSRGILADGQVGRETASHLFYPLIAFVSEHTGVPKWALCGTSIHESLHDPGATGWATPDDKGFVQVNTKVHGFTDAQVFDPEWSVYWLSDRIEGAAKTYAHPNGKPNWDIGVMSHHAPAWAKAYAENDESVLNTVHTHASGLTHTIKVHMENYLSYTKNRCLPYKKVFDGLTLPLQSEHGFQ